MIWEACGTIRPSSRSSTSRASRSTSSGDGRRSRRRGGCWAGRRRSTCGRDRRDGRVAARSGARRALSRPADADSRASRVRQTSRSGSMHRSGGSAPVASASRARAAARRPRSEPPSRRSTPRGRSGARDRTRRDDLSVDCARRHEMDRDGLLRRRRRLARRGRDLLGRRPGEPLQALEQRGGASDSRKLASGIRSSSPNVAQLGVQRVDRLGPADRVAVVDASPAAERLDLDRAPVFEDDRGHRQLVDQRLDRVRRPEPPSAGAAEVAAGGADLDRVDRLGASPTGPRPRRPSGWSCPGSTRSRAPPAGRRARTRGRGLQLSPVTQ